jgi:HEAT repeat protein
LNLEIETLVKCLLSENCVERQDARQKLVKIGKPIIPYLVGLQYSKDRRIGWESIKTIAEIAHPDGIPVLINGLENDDPNIRWLAAEGLIQIGEASVVPVLRALEMRWNSKQLREAAYHVLRGLKERVLFHDIYNLLGMLRDPARHVLVAPAAAMTLSNCQAGPPPTNGQMNGPVVQ